MKSLPNIEKSAFKRGEYVGYHHGVWRIMKSNSSYGRWWAVYTQQPKLQLYAWSLAMMSKRLSETNVIL